MSASIPLRTDRRAGVALLTALGMVPMLLSVGIAIDFYRVAAFRIALQNAADSAALAGAAVYTATGQSAAATRTANAYMTQAEATLPANDGVTFTATPGTNTNNAGTATGYTVAVTASANVPTTVMSLITPSISTSVSAGAVNPEVTITASLGNWKSSAWDANTIYWYVVPSDGSLPTSSDLHEIFTNQGNAPSSLPSITVTAGQTIGFALKNVTGGIRGYGSNQYGSRQGHTNWFYSQLSPPSADAYPTEPSNCSLEVIVATSADPNPTETAGSCSAATPANGTLNCQQLPGQTVYYFWNDMGGGVDDKDYNDAQYSITCPGAPSSAVSASAGGTAAGPTSVVLTN
ncbi:MAG: pilus assembly protein TadG-related protein [Acetobacteraceae bacterium]